MRILVVDDDPTVAKAVAAALRDDSHAVDVVFDGRSAEEAVDLASYDLVVLDRGLPAPSGIDLLRAWRREGNAVPVLMLTAHREVADRISGLDVGADDYLTKPFAIAELRARVRALLRRRGKPMVRLAAGDLELDPAARTVLLGGQPVELQPRELAVLEYLLTRVDETVTRGELAEHAWDGTFEPASNAIDVTVHRLRKKIDGGRKDKLLETVRGLGYVLRSQRR